MFESALFNFAIGFVVFIVCAFLGYYLSKLEYARYYLDDHHSVVEEEPYFADNVVQETEDVKNYGITKLTP